MSNEKKHTAIKVGAEGYDFRETPTDLKVVDKKGPLGGAVSVNGEERVDYSPEAIKEVLKENNLPAVQEIEVENPVTHVKTKVIVSRDGTPESKLILALADPNLSRDQKDHVTSMYLWERGKESASMMVDLFRYKGNHTKESRAFKSQMRFDFEMFISMFQSYLRSQADGIWKELHMPGTAISFTEKFLDFAKKEKEKERVASIYTFFLSEKDVFADDLGEERAALIFTAMNNILEADKMTRTTESIAQSRMRDKGFGIYINTAGRPYSIFDDKDLGEEIRQVIEEDKARIIKIREEEGI